MLKQLIERNILAKLVIVL